MARFKLLPQNADFELEETLQTYKNLNLSRD